MLCAMNFDVSASDYQYQPEFSEQDRNKVIWEVYHICDEVWYHKFSKNLKEEEIEDITRAYIDSLGKLIEKLKDMVILEGANANFMAETMRNRNADDRLLRRLQKDSDKVRIPLREALESAKFLREDLLTGNAQLK